MLYRFNIDVPLSICHLYLQLVHLIISLCFTFVSPLSHSLSLKLLKWLLSARTVNIICTFNWPWEWERYSHLPSLMNKDRIAGKRGREGKLLHRPLAWQLAKLLNVNSARILQALSKSLFRNVHVLFSLLSARQLPFPPLCHCPPGVTLLHVLRLLSQNLALKFAFYSRLIIMPPFLCSLPAVSALCISRRDINSWRILAQWKKLSGALQQFCAIYFDL